jgi:ferric-dicitrate binding protein FerR (iron transport regulator)
MNSSDKQFEQRLRAIYQEAAQNIDPVTAGRLRAARRTALEAATTHALPHRRARVLLPVGALAAVALAALMIWQPAPRPQDEARPQTAAVAEQENEYLPPGADKADPGLYQNLDFYSWLAANDGSQAKH